MGTEVSAFERYRGRNIIKRTEVSASERYRGRNKIKRTEASTKCDARRIKYGDRGDPSTAHFVCAQGERIFSAKS